MTYYKYIRIILILIPVSILAVLVYKDFNPAGYLKVDYDFCHSDPFISKFSPHGRVLDIQQQGTDCTQPMVIDPVYFDLRLPQQFDQARIKLWYQKDSSTPLTIGPALDLANWQWQLQDIHYLKTEDDWLLGTAQYDLTHAYMDNNRLRFLISSPGLDISGHQIIFNKIEIEFINPPLDYWSQFKNWLKFTNLYFLIT